MDYKRVLALHFTNGMSSREIAEIPNGWTVQRSPSTFSGSPA